MVKSLLLKKEEEVKTGDGFVMLVGSIIFLALALPTCIAAFIVNHDASRASCLSETSVDARARIDPAVAEKFKILTCSSTSCAQKRQSCGLDEFATFGAFYSRIQNGRVPDVQLEESPCLGSCKMSPCVAIQHEDFEGNVALDGMTGNEFTERLFHSVITEDDADRVWSCVENAVRAMAEEETEEQESDY